MLDFTTHGEQYVRYIFIQHYNNKFVTHIILNIFFLLLLLIYD